MSKRIFRQVTAVAVVLAATMANAGRYQIIAYDESNLTNAHANLTGYYFDLSGTWNLPIGWSSLSDSVSASGYARWTVRWTPDYVGEPVPIYGVVEFEAEGYLYALISSSGASGIIDADSDYLSCYLTHSGSGTSTYGNPFPAYLNTYYGGTGPLNETYPGSGVWEATLDSTPFLATTSVSLIGPGADFAQTMFHTGWTIKSIDGQPL